MSKFAYLSLPLSVLAGCNSLIPGGNLDIGDDASNVDPNLPVPTLTVTEPERGLRTNDVDGLLIGTVGGDLVANPPMVFVNQQTVAYDSDGNFEAAIEYPTGTNIIQTIAVDSLGAMNVDHRAVQSGPFTGAVAPLQEGIVFQVTREALNDITGRADDYFGAEDLATFINNPVLNEEAQTCAVWCWTWYGIEMNALNPSFQGLDVTMIPRDGGAEIIFTMHNFAMDWVGTGVVMEVGYTGTGSVTAKELTVDMDVQIGWNDGHIVVRTLHSEVNSSGFTFDFDNFMYEAMGYFGMDLDGFVVAMVESTFQDMMYSRTPSAARELIDDLSFNEPVAVMEST